MGKMLPCRIAAKKPPATMRIVVLGESWRAKKTPKQDMEFFRRYRIAFDDPRREAVYRNFQANLEGICQAAAQSGAKIVLSTMAVNLKDCPLHHLYGMFALEQQDFTTADPDLLELLDLFLSGISGS